MDAFQQSRLEVIATKHSFHERIFAFADLSEEMQRKVLDAGKTIAEGADLLLNAVIPVQSVAVPPAGQPLVGGPTQ